MTKKDNKKSVKTSKKEEPGSSKSKSSKSDTAKYAKSVSLIGDDMQNALYGMFMLGANFGTIFAEKGKVFDTKKLDSEVKRFASDTNILRDVLENRQKALIALVSFVDISKY